MSKSFPHGQVSWWLGGNSGMRWLLLNERLKLRLFSLLFSMILHGLIKVVGTGDCISDGRCGWTAFGHWLNILSGWIL